MKSKESKWSKVVEPAFSELLSNTVKKFCETTLTLTDQYANGVGDGMLQKKLRMSILENLSISFLDVREEALHWSEKGERPLKTGDAIPWNDRTEQQNDNILKHGMPEYPKTWNVPTSIFQSQLEKTRKGGKAA